LGSQADIRAKAVANGWITTDTLQNQLYTTSLNEDMHFRGVIEPFKGLKIDLIAFKTQDHNYQSNFKYLAETNSIQSLSPVTTGNYSISYLTIGTAFKKSTGIDNKSQLFQQMLANRTVISQRLAAQNPNSTQLVDSVGLRDGYGQYSQNVLVPAFLAAYTGKKAAKASTSQFPKIPIPNWDIRYRVWQNSFLCRRF
jgi:cell surface protein SprA